MTRREVLDRVNRHQREHGRPPITMRQYSRAVRIARHHRLATAEEIVEAHRSRRPRKAVRS